MGGGKFLILIREIKIPPHIYVLVVVIDRMRMITWCVICCAKYQFPPISTIFIHNHAPVLENAANIKNAGK